MIRILSVMICLMLVVPLAQAQNDSPLNEATFKGLKLRSIGPAFVSGRISDIAIHPDDDNVWYVAVGSGGVWKTKNAGVTWDPIFDDQPVYSTGCITIDPNNPHTIWVGTGENVGGRHVGFGDGIYKSEDDGKTWKNMGLGRSEHISKIIVHPSNSDVVWVAVQGPLWNSGGERGLYKSTDGGANWKKVLGGNEWTGVTDIIIDPRDPDWMYAATWQRHRTVAAYMGGGPGSGIHRSTDGGESWEKLTSGIPKSNLGKIGIDLSPFNPDVIYAAIELDRKKGGVYMSTNRGKNWAKQSDAVSGATGPHYYQELYASPHQEGRLYLMDVRIQVSDNHGKTFRRLKEEEKHSDNHSISFRADDPDYLLVGTDAGIWESFDLGENWRYINNMPITQYYKVAVDDSEPFYWVYGGTQDNGSHGGPSRTDLDNGIRHADWIKTLGADGHQSATEPGNPKITYAETQQGGLHRIDRVNGETIFIQPQPREGEDFERYNWDAPIVVSPHNPARIYFASSRVWKSDNRGDSWTPISGDLTRDQERISLPIMGRVQSWDNPWDVNAMSNYNTITSLSESPLQEGLLYVGTDDGIIQVSEDDGGNWRKIEVGSIRGVPATAFVNDIRADLHDANTVYAALDNHKYGDFNPYLIKSTDRGRTWRSIRGNLPDKHLTWRLVQDHVKKELMFAATEFGIFFTIDGGTKWIKLTGGVPTISFRDIVIQRRENDLVGASFGRSFYVLDDYSSLRDITNESLNQEIQLFATKDAYWYRPRSIDGQMGASYYTAENPPYGAVFTYHLKDGFKTLKAQRKEREKGAEGNIPFPGWEALEAERRQEKPQIILTIKDAQGNMVDQVQGTTSKGFNRVSWDLGYASKNTVKLDEPRGGQNFFTRFLRVKATPGTYSVTVSKVVDGVVTDIAGPQNFNVVPLRDQGALKGASYDQIAEFRTTVQQFQQDISATTTVLANSMKKVSAMQRALSRASSESKDLRGQLFQVKQQLLDLDRKLNGDRTKEEIGERSDPTPRNRMFTGFRSLSTTYGPTPMHRESVEIGKKQLEGIKSELAQIVNTTIPGIEEALEDIGAPWIEGQDYIGTNK